MQSRNSWCPLIQAIRQEFAKTKTAYLNPSKMNMLPSCSWKSPKETNSDHLDSKWGCCHPKKIYIHLDIYTGSHSPSMLKPGNHFFLVWSKCLKWLYSRVLTPFLFAAASKQKPLNKSSCAADCHGHMTAASVLEDWCRQFVSNGCDNNREHVLGIFVSIGFYFQLDFFYFMKKKIVFHPNLVEPINEVWLFSQNFLFFYFM